jgi:hypothetical protein
MHRTVRRISAAVLAAVAVGATAGPAPAAKIGWGVSAEGNSAGVVVNGGLQMVVECQAVGTGPMVSVAITECYTTNGVFAPDRALPGLVSATATTGRGRLESYLLCTRAVATDINSNTYDTGLQCNGDIAYAATVIATS